MPQPLLEEDSTPSPSYLYLKDGPIIQLINNLLSSSECSEFLTKYEPQLSFATTNYAQRDRYMFEDIELSSLLYSRMTKCYPIERVTDEDGCVWTPSGLNPRFRLCRYISGGYFAKHVDGRRLATLNEQSFMTVNIYLNSVPSEDRGATRILKTETRSHTEESDPEIGRIQPVQGLAAIFHHALLHDGETLLRGEKYLLRTDLMYTREVPFDMEDVFPGLSHKEQAEKALDLASRLEDANNQAEAMVWYRKAYKLNPDLS